MKRWIWFVFLGVISLSCSKDDATLDKAILAEGDLEIVRTNANYVLDDELFAFAHQNTSNEKEVNIYFQSQDEIMEAYLYNPANPSQSVKTLTPQQYYFTDFYSFTFTPGNVEATYQILVVSPDTISGTLVKTTVPFTLKHISTGTQTTDETFIRTSRNVQNEVTFSWPSDTTSSYRFIQLITTQNGDYVSATTTSSKFFRFFDRNNIRENYGPDNGFPTLVEGQTYHLALFGIDEENWCLIKANDTYIFN